MKLTDLVIEKMMEKKASANLNKEATHYMGGAIMGATSAANPRRYGTAQQAVNQINQGLNGSMRNFGQNMGNIVAGGARYAYNRAGAAIQDGVNEIKKQGYNAYGKAMNGVANAANGASNMILQGQKNLNKAVNTGLRAGTAVLDGAAKGSEALLNGSIAVGQAARGMGRSIADTAGQAANAAQRYGKQAADATQRYGQQAVNSARRFGAGVGGFFRGLGNYYMNRGR